MNAPAKFLFEDDFAVNAKPAKPMVSLAAHQSALARAEEVYESTHQRLEEIARMHGFDGRLVVLAEPGMALGDCRIEWADGGLSRDRASTEAAIGEAVTRYVAVRRGDTPA